MPPFVRQYAWHCIEPLDVAAMQRGVAARFVGEHDFAAFRSARSLNHTTVREITSASWRRGEDATLIFEIAGKGFLRYMVRSLVGTLVEIGRGAAAGRATSPACWPRPTGRRPGAPRRRAGCS